MCSEAVTSQSQAGALPKGLWLLLSDGTKVSHNALPKTPRRVRGSVGWFRFRGLWGKFRVRFRGWWLEFGIRG